MKKYLSILSAVVVIMVLTLSYTTYAARTVDSVTLNGSNSVVVQGGTSITASLTVTLSGSTNNKWYWTTYKIGNGPEVCVDTPDYSITGTPFTATFPVIASSTEGTYDVVYKILGTAGCSGTGFTTATSTNGIVVDNTAPIITIDPYNASSTNQNITVTASTNEGVLNATSTVFTSNGNFDFVATDDAGNVSTSTVTISNIDKIAPVITITNPGTAPAQSKTVTALTDSGVLSMSVDSGSVCGASLSFVPYDSVTFNTEGDNGKKVCYKAEDIAGNISYSASDAIGGIDITAPIASVGYSTTAWTNSDVVATITPFESITVTNNGGSLSYNFTDNGNFTFEFVDNAGNIGSSSAVVSNIDKIAPEITIVNPNTTPAKSKTITATSNEGTLSMAVNSGDVCDATLSFLPYDSVTFNSEADNGKKVCYKAEDLAGNVTYSISNAIAGIDTTAPVITITGENPTRIHRLYTYTDAGATATDNMDGDITSSITVSNTVNTALTGTYIVTYCVTDAAGNKAEDKTRTVTVYRTAMMPVSNTVSPVTGQVLGASTSTVETNTGVTYEPLTVTSSTTPVIGQVLGATKFIFSNNMKLGSKISPDVKELQDLLRTEGFFNLATSTGVFGPITKAAVIKYQEKYSDAILKPLGLTSGTGIVAEYTRAQLNK
jgi:Domain of unknown function (DUF5011)/Putative peptidoglycan binding domain